MWECPCLACIALIFLVRQLFLVWIPAACFPQCVLALLPLRVGVTDVLTRVCTGGWARPPLCSVVVTALLGAGQLFPVIGVKVVFFVLLTSTILKSNYQLFCRISFSLDVSDIFLLLDCGYESTKDRWSTLLSVTNQRMQEISCLISSHVNLDCLIDFSTLSLQSFPCN